MNTDYCNWTALFPSPVESKGQTKSERVSRHESFDGDDTSSNKSLKTMFPELQSLPEYAKMPIRKFLRERISSFESAEDVSTKLKLLAEATESLYDEDGKLEEEGKGTDTGVAGGTILHTAAAVGNRYLIEVLIEAGADVTALDRHSWTALMVAKAQEHEKCSHILSRQMKTIGASYTTRPLSPSRMTGYITKASIQLEPDNLIATFKPQNSNVGWMVLWADHPVPIDSHTFYYEMTILKLEPPK